MQHRDLPSRAEMPVSTTPITLADVLDRLAGDTALSTTRQRDLMSAVRSLGRIIGEPLDEIPASPKLVRSHLKGLEAAEFGITAKRFKNIKSDALFALRHVGAVDVAVSRTHPMNPEWDALWRKIDHEQRRWKLSRFFRYCSANDVAPADVNAATIVAFEAAIEELSFTRDPHGHVRGVIWAWNRCQEEISDWPSERLALLPRGPRGWTYAITDFPEPFQRDFDAWFQRLGSDDLFAEGGPVRPLRPETIRLRVQQVRMFASALVFSGVPIAEVTGLATLVTMENFRAALAYLYERQGKKRTEAFSNLIATIKGIARDYVRVPEDDLAEIDRIHQRNRVRERGLTPKTRTRLRQFDNPRNVDALLRLPHQEAARVARATNPGPKEAFNLQMAVAVEILIMTIIRSSNLARLEEGRHLHWSRPQRRGDLSLSIEGMEVKNGRAIDFDLPVETSRLVRTYMQTYRPLLKCPETACLFPGKDGQPKKASLLSQQIKRFVKKRTGLDVSAHLFRHLGAKLFLEEDPRAYVSVQLLAGHRSSDTTVDHYVGIEATTAGRVYDDLILERRGHRRPGLRRRRR